MAAPDDRAQQEELATWLKTQYADARVLSDGSVAALQDLIFTRAILLGCNREGWEARFCFADVALATRLFGELQSENETPQGAIATRDFR